MLSKNINNKKCSPKLIFFNGKKMRKILMIFDIENWLWKSNFGSFDTSPLHQFSKFNIFLWVCWYLVKNLSNFVSPPNPKLDICIGWQWQQRYSFSWCFRNNKISNMKPKKVRNIFLYSTIYFRLYSYCGWLWPTGAHFG